MINTVALFLVASCLLSWVLFALQSPKTVSHLVQRLQSVWASTYSQSDESTDSSTPGQELSELQKSFPPERRSAWDGDTSIATQRQTQLLDPSRCVPDTHNVLEPRYANHLTPTGFSVKEIAAMGTFPDYAKLSGVPLPTPYHGFDIQKAQPRPYRPLRWAYHQTMSLTKMESDWWLELESTYVSRIKQRQELYAKYGGQVMQQLPGSEIATRELMEMVLQFLCARYPQYFQLTPSSSPTTFHNRILNNTADLVSTPPLRVLLDHVPEDFAIMLRSPATGTYSFRAGVICSSLGWNLGSKIGLPLSGIHAPIPDYKEKMSFSMDRYFGKKPVDKPIQRGSWGLEIGSPLFMPPGDPHEALREKQDPSHTLDQANLRVDWQTLRRLPLSAAVVFNFKAIFTPVTEFRDEPYVPKLMLRVLRDGKKNLMEYKNTWHTEHLVIPALEEMIAHQEAEGLVEKDWEEHTLDESPFFVGWREKWTRQQGFAAPA